MPTIDVLREQPDGTMQPVTSIKDEADHVVDSTMEIFNTYENKNGEPIVLLREVADYFNVSVGTIIKGFREKDLPYCDYRVAKVLATDLRTYLHSCYHSVGEFLCRGELCFITIWPVVQVRPITSEYIITMLRYQRERKDSVDRKMMTASEVAQELGMGVKKVYSLLKSGKMPFFKIGSMYRVSAECLAIYHGISAAAIAIDDTNQACARELWHGTK